MPIIRCASGHYYDDKNYVNCPFCGIQLSDVEQKKVASSLSSDDIKTEAIRRIKDESVTMSIEQSNNGQTIGVYSGSVRSNPVVGWIVCTSGPEKGRDYRIHAGRNFIGRSGKMDISIMDDPQISRENHASIVFDPKSKAFYLVSDNSATTACQGNAVIDPVQIYDNDLISMGSSEFRFIAYCKGDIQW